MILRQFFWSDFGNNMAEFRKTEENKKFEFIICAYIINRTGGAYEKENFGTRSCNNVDVGWYLRLPEGSGKFG